MATQGWNPALWEGNRIERCGFWFLVFGRKGRGRRDCDPHQEKKNRSSDDCRSIESGQPYYVGCHAMPYLDGKQESALQTTGKISKVPMQQDIEADAGWLFAAAKASDQL